MAFEENFTQSLAEIAGRLVPAIEAHGELKARIWQVIKDDITPERVLANEASNLALQTANELANLIQLLATDAVDSAALDGFADGTDVLGSGK